MCGSIHLRLNHATLCRFNGKTSLNESVFSLVCPVLVCSQMVKEITTMKRQITLACPQMMRTSQGILAAVALAVAGFAATAQAQEKPEEKPPADIWQAAAKGDMEAIKGFLAKGSKIDDQNKDGYSVLHVAIRSGQAAVAEFALANGADINLRSNSKKTPLHYAAQYNRLALAKQLVEAKPDLAATPPNLHRRERR